MRMQFMIDKISDAFKDSEAISYSAIQLINNRAADLNINPIIACIMTKKFLERIIEDYKEKNVDELRMVAGIIDRRMEDLKKKKR